MTAPRLPTDLQWPGRDALARLPVFLALEGRRAVVAGGNAQAAWKAELLSAAGANVEVFAEAPADELVGLAQNPPRGAVTIIRRRVGAEDFAGAAVAVRPVVDDFDPPHFATPPRAPPPPLYIITNTPPCPLPFPPP